MVNLTLPTLNSSEATLNYGWIFLLSVDIGTGMKGGLEGGKTIVTEHMKKGGLSGIIKAEEKDLTILIGET